MSYFLIGHKSHWYSSPMYSGGFAINYIVNTAILSSGGGVHQFHRFCHFINLVNDSKDSFNCNQQRYAAPTINQAYIEKRREVMSIFSTSDSVIRSEDCRMDSPGFSATKGIYSLMEHETGHILHMEHGDKREVLNL